MSNFKHLCVKSINMAIAVLAILVMTSCASIEDLASNLSGDTTSSSAQVQPSSFDNNELKQECDKNSAIDCALLGIRYQFGHEGVERNINYAETLYLKACNLNFGDACAFAGMMYITENMQKDDIAKELLQKGCNLNSKRSCAGLAIFYMGYKDAPKDYSKAKGILQKACDLKDGLSCAAIAEMYYNGIEVPRNVNKAIYLAQRGCNLKDGMSCATLSGMYFLEKDYDKAVKAMQQGCDLENGRACKDLATAYYRGIGVPYNLDAAIGLYRKSCDLNFGASCTAIASFLLDGIGVDRDEKAAVEALQKSCDLNYSDGCAYFGSLYHNGTKIPKNENKAIQLLTKACDLDHDNKDACALLAKIKQSKVAHVPANTHQQSIQQQKELAFYKDYTSKMEAELEAARKFILEVNDNQNSLNINSHTP